MPTSQVAFYWALGGIVLAGELLWIRRTRGRLRLSVVGPVALGRRRAIRAFADWLMEAQGLFGSVSAVSEEPAEVGFRWGPGNRMSGRAKFSRLDEHSAMIDLELDQAARTTFRYRLALTLLFLVGIPVAVGAPLLVAHLAGESGGGTLVVLGLMVHLYWPIAPLVDLIVSSRSLERAITVGFRNLPLFDEGP